MCLAALTSRVADSSHVENSEMHCGTAGGQIALWAFLIYLFHPVPLHFHFKQQSSTTETVKGEDEEVQIQLIWMICSSNAPKSCWL